jgi:hypothetical protein
LQLIEVYDLGSITLSYRYVPGALYAIVNNNICSKSQFSDPLTPATVAKVQQSFGATHPGGMCNKLLNNLMCMIAVYDAGQQMYILSWTGLSFCFAADASTVSACTYAPAAALGALQLPDGPSPNVAKMCIYAGSSMNEARCEMK